MTAEGCRMVAHNLTKPYNVECHDPASSATLEFNHSITVAHWEIAAQLAELNKTVAAAALVYSGKYPHSALEHLADMIASK